MTPPVPTGPRVAVVGAGVLGLLCALRLAEGGARVVLHEGRPDYPNASSVAAGMIAPAAECALEPELRPFAAALRVAREAWTGLAVRLGAPLSALGTTHVGSAEAMAERAELMAGLGFVVDRPRPSSTSPAGCIFTPQDALISTAVAMPALRRIAAGAGVGVLRGEVTREGGLLRSDGQPLDADVVVLATGARGRASGLAPELARLSPIKGQLLRWPNPDRTAHATLRTDDLYLATLPDEIIAGATMEPGRDDLAQDPAAVARLREAARSHLSAEVVGIAPVVGVGVRADTPDGLPMVGPSAAPGVILATGARRNGWLWAPMVADLVAAYVFGSPSPALAPLAERLHPGRFSDGEAR